MEGPEERLHGRTFTILISLEDKHFAEPQLCQKWQLWDSAYRSAFQAYAWEK
jgi:hypothetical protein